MASAESMSTLPEAFTCPVCLRNSQLPTILQCMHYICRDCISHENAEATQVVTCLFCNTKEPFQHCSYKGTGTDLPRYADDLMCGPCQSEHKITPAAIVSYHCVDCEENLCGDCNSLHAKFRNTRHHNTMKLDEQVPFLPRKLYCEDCKDQRRRVVEFFCKDHDSRCCGSCAIRTHKDCNVHDIEHLVERIKNESLIDDLCVALDDSKNKMQFIVNASKENIVKLEDQVNEIRTSVKDLRKHINDLLDQFEIEVVNDSERILQREKDINNDQIKTCLRFTTAVEQSCNVFDEAVDSASNANFYYIFKKVENHNLKYASFITKTLEDRKFTELELAINSKVTDVLADGNIGALNKTEHPARITPVRKKTIERKKMVRAVTKLDGRIPRYSSAAYLPNGDICLVDCNNKRCGLFDSSFQNLDVISFRSCPWTTASISSEELAVSLPLERKIQIYTINENKFQSSRCISTVLPCWGVAPADEGNIAVAVDCKGASPGVGVISSGGLELFHLRADESEINFGQPWQFDYEIKRSRFLIACQSRDSAVCINTKGRFIFEYKNEKLSNPAGITHDADGNIYICGLKSHNIHQVTPNGDLMRIISLPKLRTPFSICFCRRSDNFLVTTVQNREELQLFSLS